jgi:galactokinase
MTATISAYGAALSNGRYDMVLTELYGPGRLAAQRNRYFGLLNSLARRYGDGPAILVSAPGRTELGGNHTDHNHGRVLAAAVDLDCAASAKLRDDAFVELHSEGFADPLRVDLSSLGPRAEEKGTSAALVRGVAAGFAAKGYKIGGFNACVQGTVPVGAGLSSSAAFEILIASIFNLLYNSGNLSGLELALIGQSAEVDFFGKPCGFMDQLTSAVGGVLQIDFQNPAEPSIERIDADFTASGYHLVIADTGLSHADLTEDYAAIPREMRAVAETLGLENARGVSIEALLAALPALRDRTGDRAILRVLHFLGENRRVEAQAAALRENRIEDYLHLVDQSGDSSWRRLQNCVNARAVSEQSIPLALALTEDFLTGRGSCRVHGGGFAGAIQAYIPQGRLDEYRRLMEPVFGPGCVRELRIRQFGGLVFQLK